MNLYNLTEEEFREFTRQHPNVENDNKFFKRINKFIIGLGKHHQSNDHIVLVSHGGTQNTILSSLYKTDLQQTSYYKFGRTSLSILEQENGNRNKRLFNCTQHLNF